MKTQPTYDELLKNVQYLNTLVKTLEKSLTESKKSEQLSSERSKKSYDIVTKEINKRKQAIEKLHRHNELILNTAGEGIYGLDLNGNTTFINPAASKLIGWETEEILGRNQHEIFHHTKPDGTAYPSGSCPIQAAYRDGKTYKVDNEVFWRKDGSSFPVEYISTPIRNIEGEIEGAVVTFRDITKRKQADNMTESMFKILQTIQSAKDLDELLPELRKSLGNIIDTTNFYVALYDQISDTISFPYFADSVDEPFTIIKASESGSFTARVIREGKPLLLKKKQIIKWLNIEDKKQWGSMPEIWFCVPLIVKKKIIGAIGVQSYTNPDQYSEKDTIILESASEHIAIAIERMQAEEALKELNRTLEQRVEERTSKLQAVNKELSDFAYIVSHDLKAPLRGISQLAQWTIQDYSESLDEKGREMGELIIERVRHMNNLIDGILQYSRIGRIIGKIEKIDLNKLVTEVINIINPPENIIVSIENELPVIIGNVLRFEQIFQNLIQNSCKYMDKTNGKVIISCTEEETHLKFSISDNGPGIDPKYHKKIFTIFQTLETGEKSTNTGIGLTIVKKIVELFGGNIWVESKPGKGSIFYFTVSKEWNSKQLN